MPGLSQSCTQGRCMAITSLRPNRQTMVAMPRPRLSVVPSFLSIPTMRTWAHTGGTEPVSKTTFQTWARAANHDCGSLARSLGLQASMPAALRLCKRARFIRLRPVLSMRGVAGAPATTSMAATSSHGKTLSGLVGASAKSAAYLLYSRSHTSCGWMASSRTCAGAESPSRWTHRRNSSSDSMRYCQAWRRRACSSLPRISIMVSNSRSHASDDQG